MLVDATSLLVILQLYSSSKFPIAPQSPPPKNKQPEYSLWFLLEAIVSTSSEGLGQALCYVA